MDCGTVELRILKFHGSVEFKRGDGGNRKQKKILDFRVKKVISGAKKLFPVPQFLKFHGPVEFKDPEINWAHGPGNQGI